MVLENSVALIAEPERKPESETLLEGDYSCATKALVTRQFLNP